jgi:hypothetical protein
MVGRAVTRRLKACTLAAGARSLIAAGRTPMIYADPQLVKPIALSLRTTSVDSEEKQ